MPGPLTLIYPQALALALVLVWLYARRLHHRNLWRLVALIIAVALLGYPMLRQPKRALDLYAVMDRSRSITEPGREKELELYRLLPRQLQDGDRIGLVTFNTQPYFEGLGEKNAAPGTLKIPYPEEGTDIAAAINLVLSQAAPDRRTRMVLFSDGEYTGADPRPLARLAAQRGIPIDYRDLPRLETFNLGVSNAELPDQIDANAPFKITFHVQSTAATPGRYRLLRNGHVMGESKDQGWRPYEFKAGENILEFQDTLSVAAIHGYKLEVEASPREKETVFADNAGEQYTKVLGERPLLIVNHTGAADNFARALAASGVPAHLASIGNFKLRLPQLTGYKALVLNGVPLTNLPLDQIQDIRNFVLQEGGGLLVTGGKTSFASGGYYKSPLESILPVRLEDRQQSKRVSTAFSIAIDRSGSMAMTTPGGKQKIELAGEAAAQCIQLMSPADSISVIPVDSASHIMIEQQPVGDPASLVAQVRKIESMGGGIFIYEALDGAGQQIINAPQLNKHILLLADAADSEEPGDYVNLLDSYKKAGITVSVVGLGTEHDPDADLLKDVAKRGGGSIYFTDDAEQLVQFFTADTLTYTRNSFIKDAVPIKVRPGSRALSADAAWADFTAGGYNLLFAAENAEVALQTADSDKAPVLAFWQRELGRVAALAFDTNGPFSASPEFAKIVNASTHWVTGGEVEDAIGARVVQDGGQARVRLELSAEERARLGPAKLQIFTPDNQSVTMPLHWEGYDSLAAEFPLLQGGLHRAVITYGGKTMRLPPLSLPASPELLPHPGRAADFGRATLAEIAALSGGKRVQDMSEITRGAVKASVVAPIITPLLIALLAIFLIEIAEARFGLLAWLSYYFGKFKFWRNARRARRPVFEAELPPVTGSRAASSAELTRAMRASSTKTRTPKRPTKETTAPQPAAVESAPEEVTLEAAETPKPTGAPSSTLGYLSKSKTQAGKRLDK